MDLSSIEVGVYFHIYSQSTPYLIVQSRCTEGAP